MRTRLARMMMKGARQPQRPYPVKADRPLRVIDKTRPLQPAPEATQWLVLIVAPRREADAVQALRDAGHRAWHPQLTTWITSARLRIKSKVNRPLFPRYIFVAKMEGAAKSIEDCDHCGKIIGPVIKPRKECRPLLEVLSSKQAAGEFDGTIAKPIPMFDEGEWAVFADEGPFHGLKGIVQKTEGERVMILMNILGADNRIEANVYQLVPA